MLGRIRSIKNWILSILVFIGISVACFLPAIAWAGIYLFLSPTGFWQKFVVFGIGIWFLGGLQIIGLFVFIGFWIHVLGWMK